MTSIEERVQAAIAPELAKADLIINELLDGKPLQPAGKHRSETATVGSTMVMLRYEAYKAAKAWLRAAGLLDAANHTKVKIQ